MCRARATLAKPETGQSDDPGLVEKLQAEFNAHLAGERFPAAIAASRRLLGLLMRQENPKGLAAAEIALGTALMACGNPREAWPSFARARAILRAQGSPEDLASAHFNLGLDFGRMKRFALAKATFRRASELYAKAGISKELRQCQVYLAHSMLILGDFEEAEAMAETAGQEAVLLEGSALVTNCQTEAMALLSRGEFVKAEEALAREYRAAQALCDSLSMADSLFGIALLKLRHRELWAAQGLLLEAQACIAGLDCRDAEEQIQRLLRKTKPSRKPKSLTELAGLQPMRRCS